MNFGERLRFFREQAGYTQEQVAKAIGVAKSTITGYEKGNREPDVLKIVKLAKFLEVSGDDLIGISDYENNPHETSDCNRKTPTNKPQGLSKKESELVQAFRECAPEDQDAISHIAIRLSGQATEQPRRLTEEEVAEIALAQLEAQFGSPVKHQESEAK